MAKEIAEEYTSSLADLTLNSKPLINMLTMLADDNIEHAESIVEAVEKHLEKVRSEFKLPVLYLIDSIVKNVGHAYTNLFTQNIVNTFCSVFEKVDEKVRAQMFKLRQTWADVFPAKKLYTLDIRVQCIDPAWPLIAPTPTPSIHVNPKFFAKPAKPVITPTVPAAPKMPVALDSATLDMQTQLINKQKELLELKQKKLELELLQAKAKLEEQQKQLEKQSIQIKTPTQHSLLKPEVAKQMMQGMKSDDNRSSGKMTSAKASVGANNSSGGPRIAPVNSALLASVRPVLRDPRLLRQQPPSSAGGAPPAANPNTLLTQNNTTSNNSNYETVNLVDEKQISNKVTKKSLHTQNNSTISLDCVIVDSNSKSNKSGVLNRSKDPRLISNKIQGSKSKLSPNNGRSSERSPKKPSTTSRKSTKTSSNNSRSSFKSPVSATDSTDKVASKISDATLTVKSPTSPSKYIKKLKDSPKSAIDPKRVKSNIKETKIPRIREKFDDSISTNSTIVAPPVPPALVVAADQQRVFKGLKTSAKVRNYIRRNRAISISPEPSQDVDLRIPPEKQARLHSDEETAKSATIDDIPSNKDVDLRTLVVPAPINKKRSSTEKLESSNAKKSKSQMFDVLFGNEDVDLRQLPPVISTPVVMPSKPVLRPPTPPPPIISTPPTERTEPSKEIVKAKVDNTAKANLEAMRAKSNLEAIRTKSNLDAIRAKLANATKKSALSEETRKISEDTDMRLRTNVFSELPQEALQKIIISQADEQLIRNGNLSQALVEKVLTLFETQKLQEAQRRESEEFRPDMNITLQLISDDELSVDFSHSESEDDKVTRTPDVQIFKDTDERVPPPAPMISQNQNEMSQKPEQNEQERIQQPNVDPRLQHRMGSQNTEVWQGGHHRRRRPKTHWDSPPPHPGALGHPGSGHPGTGHPGPDPWLRPPPVLNQALNQAMNQGMYGPRRPFPGFIRPPGDFGPRMDFIPQFVDGSRSPPTIGSQTTKELPMADPLVLEYIEQDTMRTINIDGRPREIRYYEETAIVIMSWDDPREISFQNGTRIITFDDKESFTLSFNDSYRDVTIGGKPHRIRLGAPTRELYIDGKWYECFFGGPGIGIEVDGQIRVVKMEGPAPHVKIGTVKRTDFVAGKINLIINARQMVPVFLDAKPQKFDIEGKIHTLRFVDALRTVLINEVPFKVEFGGLPKPIAVHDKKHFIRFSVLPRGVKPGYITLANMEGTRFPSPPRIENETESMEPFNMQANEPALPMLGKRRLRQTESPDSNRNSPTMQNQTQLGSLDVLSSIMTSPMANSSNVTGYQVDNQDSQDSFPILKSSNEIPGLTIEAPSVPSISNNLNINELFQKLVASGIVTSAKEKTPPPVHEEKIHHPIIRPILFNKSETLKLRQQPLISALYSGMQCSSCGVRFPPEHSMQYSQHLDWHFRQNRRGRNSARKALCRKWYYDVSDWKNFEEIEDIEEREKSWFESQQQQQADGNGEDGDEEIEIPSVPADVNSQSTACEVCRDKFDQFYNEEKEEWHLRMAIRVDEKTYHPLCYDDYKASLLANNIEEPPEQKEQIPEEPEHKIEETKIEDSETELKVDEKMEIEEDDDVVIQEPKIEQITIDDRMDLDEKDDPTKTENDDYVICQGGIFIKQEPIDEFDISGIKTEVLDSEIEGIGVPMMERVADTTRAELLSSIDGNVEQMVSGPSGISGKIKITITKPILAPKEPVASTTVASEPEAGIIPEPIVDANEPLPPGEEPVQLNLKPALQGVTLAKQAPVLKGTELTGLCSIM